MVEQLYRLDAVFQSLSDPTRRDIVKRVSEREQSVSEIAHHYHMSLAGVAKHLEVLTQAGLVSKTRRGKEQIVALVPDALAEANDYLETYREFWEQRLDNLDKYLKTKKK